MLKERRTIQYFFSNSLPSLFSLLEDEEEKEYLREVIFQILGLMLRDLEYEERMKELLGKKSYINVDIDFERFRARDYNVFGKKISFSIYFG